MKLAEYIYIYLTVKLSLSQDTYPVPDTKLSAWLGPCLVRIDEPCRKGDVVLTYFNSYDRNIGRILDVYDPDAGPWFDPELPTKIIIHGYNEYQKNHNVYKIPKAYLKHDDYNVIDVSWLRLSSPFVCVTSSRLNGPHVAQCLAEGLFGLERNYPGFDATRVHVVGFSFGAHIAGHLSRILLRKRGRRVERITGLDPATSLVSGSGNWWNLDSSDADFVDVIHTNAGFSGVVDAIGDIDFYVNRGSFQPGCGLNTSCSHTRAAALFAESISSEAGFWGIKCAALPFALVGFCPTYDTQPREIMGDLCYENARGIFYVNTDNASPFALGYQ